MSDAMRLECLKAAAVVVAGHPDNEVAYEEGGQPIGATTVDITRRVITMATDFEAYVKDQPSTLAEETREEIAATAPSPSEEKLGREMERVAIADEDFNIDVCPIHKEANESNYDSQARKLYCPKYQSESCEWQRKNFFNTDDDGETTTVTKYRMEKGKNKFFERAAFIDMLRSSGVIE